MKYLDCTANSNEMANNRLGRDARDLTLESGANLHRGKSSPITEYNIYPGC
jgi:hypothetical protein